MKINGIEICVVCSKELNFKGDFCSLDCSQEYEEEKSYMIRYENRTLTPKNFYKRMSENCKEAI